MIIKAFIVAMMLVVTIYLGSALVSLVKDKGQTNSTVKSLSWRLGLSLCLFIALFVGFSMGWISPHGL